MKRRKKIYLSIVCLSIIIGIISGCGRSTSKTSLRLKKGNSFKVELNKEQKVSLKNQEFQTKIRSAYLCQVTNVDENKNVDIKVTFDSINLKLDNPSKISIQSDIFGKNEELQKAYSLVIGESFNIKIGEFGEVKSIIGIDKLVKNILKVMNVKDKNLEEKIKNAINLEFGEEILTKKIENITTAYPKQNISVGKIWDNKVDADSVFQLETFNKYTLKESKDKVDDISVKAKIKPKEKAEPIIINKIKVYYKDLTGKQEGSISINEDTGLIRRAELVKDLNGNLKIVSDDPNEGVKTIPIIIKEKILTNVLIQ